MVYTFRWYILFSGTDGCPVKLYVTASLAAPDQPLKIALSSGLTPQNRDLRRPSCPSGPLIAEPVVQRRVDSNAGLTLNAADITTPPLWVFNSGEYEVGAFHACLPDPTRNRIHYAAQRPFGTFQDGIWSIDTNTDALAWAGITEVTVTGSVFGGIGTHTLAYPFANGSDAVTGGTESPFLSAQGNAGIQFDKGVHRTVFLGFPLEALPGHSCGRESFHGSSTTSPCHSPRED